MVWSWGLFIFYTFVIGCILLLPGLYDDGIDDDWSGDDVDCDYVVDDDGSDGR